MTEMTTVRPANDRLIRLREVLRIVPLSRSTIYVRVSEGKFPAPVDLGGGLRAWYESDVREWIASRPRAA